MAKEKPTKQSLIYVPPEGNLLLCKYFFIGGTPGAEEEKHLTPFVGRGGQLLRNALTDLGVNDSGWKSCYFTYVCKVRPLANRVLRDDEYMSWLYLLDQELRKAPRKIVITMGPVAIAAASDLNSVSKFYTIAEPTYILRQPSAKAEWLKQLEFIIKGGEA
jgi:uracil-DNA glycosylase family 4